MRYKVVVSMVLLILLSQLAGGFAFAVNENEAPPAPQENSEPEPAPEPESSPFIEHPFIDNLMEAMAELMETIREYIEQVQDSVMDLVPGIGEEEEIVEEPAPVPEDEVPVAGMVEGRLTDNDRNPLSEMRVVMGARETVTDGNGSFIFEEVDFGTHQIYLMDPGFQEDVFLTEFQIDENNPHYAVNITVSMPEPGDDPEEIEVAPAPVEEPDEPGRGALLFFLGILALLVLAIVLFLLFRRKHIQIVDAKTGETIGSQKIKVYPRTKIDLTEAFEYAYGDAVRVQFLKPIIKKLWGHRILFIYDEEQVIGEIESYAGELEYPVRLPQAPKPGEQPPSDEGEAGRTGNNGGTA